MLLTKCMKNFPIQTVDRSEVDALVVAAVTKFSISEVWVAFETWNYRYIPAQDTASACGTEKL